MTVKAKRFRIGVEGATTDGREIQREWLEQMAASYNPAVYTALINLEHIKSYLPDSTFNRYGKVTALFAEEITEGPLAGKMALYADVEPTESLVELVKKGQKLFTSMEVSPKFADTGKAYLVGLAATDDPASLGTEMLTFSASAAHNPLANRKQNPANLFTAAEEAVIELEEIQDDKPSLFARVTALFTKKEQSDDARFSDVHKAVELVATEQQNLSAHTEKSLSEQEERLSELETALQAQQTAFNELVDKLSHEDSRQDYRQRATGSTAAVTRTSSALSWLAGAPLALLRRGLASSGNAAGLLTAPLSSLRRTASLTGNVLKTVAGAPVALLQSGLSGLRAVAVMFMNPLAVLRGGLAAAGTVLRVLASGPLAMLRVALYAISGLLGALLSPIGLVVTALAGVALVVWKYWQPITAFLGGVVEGFKAAAGPISAAFEPLKPVFQWIGDKVQALWGWFTDLLTPVKSTSAELQSAAAMGRRFGEALAEGLNMVMHPLDSLKSGVSWLLEKLGIVSKEAAKAKLLESVTRQQPATVNADGKVMIPSGGFPSWGYGFAGMYDSGGYIPRGQFGIVGENGPEIVNGPANVTSRRNTAALAAVVAGMMGVAAAPAELPPLHPLALPAKGGEAIVSRAATVPLVQRIEAPTQIIIQTQPGQSAQDIAREVARQLDERERRLKAKARSNYSDQGGYDA